MNTLKYKISKLNVWSLLPDNLKYIFEKILKKLDSISIKYSTEEQLTGDIWINEKPIYRKVISFTVPSDYNGAFTIQHNLSINEYLKAQVITDRLNIDKISSFDISDLPSNNSLLLQITADAINFNTNDIYFEEIQNSGQALDAHLILEYTKQN